MEIVSLLTLTFFREAIFKTSKYPIALQRRGIGVEKRREKKARWEEVDEEMDECQADLKKEKALLIAKLRKQNKVVDVGKETKMTNAIRLLEQYASRVREQNPDEKREKFYAYWKTQRQKVRDLLRGYGSLCKTYWHLGERK